MFYDEFLAKILIRKLGFVHLNEIGGEWNEYIWGVFVEKEETMRQ